MLCYFQRFSYLTLKWIDSLNFLILWMKQVGPKITSYFNLSNFNFFVKHLKEKWLFFKKVFQILLLMTDYKDTLYDTFRLFRVPLVTCKLHKKFLFHCLSSYIRPTHWISSILHTARNIFLRHGFVFSVKLQ